MKDIDFDELDRAVSSLMGKVSAPDDVSAQRNQVESSEKLKSTSSVDAAQILESVTAPPVSTTENKGDSENFSAARSPQPSAEQSTSSQVISPSVLDPSREDAALSSEARPPLAVKRSGRFMDVVHPSSDMRQMTPPAPVRPRYPREGVSITPPVEALVTDIIAPVSSNQTAIISEPTSIATVSDEKEATLPTRTETRNNFSVEQPDVSTVKETQVIPQTPSDKSTDAEQKSIDEVEPAQVAQTDAPEDDIEDINIESGLAEELRSLIGEKQPNTVGDEPIGSPFLTNVTPEKRPLGGSDASSKSLAADNVDKQSDVTEAEVSQSNSERNNDNAASTPEVFLPEEFSEDILAVESASSRQYGDISSSSESATQTEAPVSIAMQYQTKSQRSESADNVHGALYDTAAISSGIHHPAKKKSGWLVVLMVVFLVALGVGIAVALYFLNII